MGICDSKNFPGEKPPDPILRGAASNAGSELSEGYERGMRGKRKVKIVGKKEGTKERMVPPTFETKVTPLLTCLLRN